MSVYQKYFRSILVVKIQADAFLRSLKKKKEQIVPTKTSDK